MPRLRIVAVRFRDMCSRLYPNQRSSSPPPTRQHAMLSPFHHPCLNGKKWHCSGCKETLPPFRKKIPQFGEKVPQSIFGLKLGSKMRVFGYIFHSNHMLFKKLVSLILKYVKNLLIYPWNLKKYFSATFPLLIWKFHRGTAINFLREKIFFSSLLLSKITKFSTIWQQGILKWCPTMARN